MAIKPSDRLIQKIRDNGHALPEGTELHRTNASRASRNAGAWSWFAMDANGSELHIGSITPISELLKVDITITKEGGICTDYQVDPASWLGEGK